jgi:hypothetical protein
MQEGSIPIWGSSGFSPYAAGNKADVKRIVLCTGGCSCLPQPGSGKEPACLRCARRPGCGDVKPSVRCLR